jgi:hypothetical protein
MTLDLGQWPLDHGCVPPPLPEIPMDRSTARSSRPRRLAALAAMLPACVLLMAMSPAPSGPGPAVARPPASPMAVPTGPLFPEPSVDPLSQPSGGGAAVSPPAEILGAWYNGSVSSVGYVDQTTGSYSDGGSEGLAYTFLPDGTWQFGYLLSSALYGCQMRVLVFNEGELASTDPATHLIELRMSRSQMHSEDTCSESGNYDKELAPADETLIWDRTTDEYGDVLMLRHPDTGYSAFRPAQ